MLVTLSGIVSWSGWCSDQNASSPMLVTLLPIVTLVRLVQSAERPLPDAGDAVGDRDAGQAGAGIERIVPDAGDAIGNDVVSGFARRILDERGPCSC